MSTEFRKIPNAAAANLLPLEELPVQLWIPPATKQQAETRLYHFLRSVSEGQPQTDGPLLLDARTLATLYTHPHSSVLEVLRHCIDLFLLELDPNTAYWGKLELTTPILGVALAAYDCLCAPLMPAFPLALSEQKTRIIDPTVSFLEALTATLPPARTLAELLAYHVLLRPLAEALPTLPESRARLAHALLNRSPLSSLCYLHISTPSPLPTLGRDLLPWWKQRTIDPAPWKSFDDWLRGPVLLLAQPAIAVFLRQRWLSLPETHRACRNLGLLLEGLRRQGQQRAFLLEFYEAYDFFCAVKAENPAPGRSRYWPVLRQIERLVRTQGDIESDIPLQLNRIGNEYFLKFCALINIIITEERAPRDYQRLTMEFIAAIRELVPYTILGYTNTRPGQKPVQFVSKDRP